MGQDDKAEADLMGPEPAAPGVDRVHTRNRVLTGLFGPDAPGARELGPTVAGRFEVVRSLGKGAMGEVLLARDRSLDRLVALKRLRSSGRETPERTARVLREARALARVHHPHVVTLFEAISDGPTILLVMEYVPGQSLTRWLAQGPTLDEIVVRFWEAALGLAAIHSSGLVHRDFKPDNVLVGDDGRVRVADLGLARLGGETPPGDPSSSSAGHDSGSVTKDDAVPPSLTRTGALVGTPLYMAPEQLVGEAADARSDQFSFGVALFEAVFGVRPFEGKTPQALAVAICSGRRTPPLEGRRVPAWLAAVIGRALQADPADRFESVEQIAARLDPTTRGSWRRRVRTATTAVVLTALAAGGIAVLVPDEGPSNLAGITDPCPYPDEALADIWGSGPREALEARAKAVLEPPDVEPVVAGATRRVEAFVEAWRAEQHAACRATLVRHTRSDEQLERSNACFERGAGLLRSIMRSLPTMDERDLGRLPRTLSRLPKPTRCADATASVGSEASRALLERAEAELMMGRYDVAAATLDEVATTLAGEDEEPALHAELAFGRAEVARGKNEVEGAVNGYLRAAELAESSRRDHLAARTWLRVVAEGATEARDPERAAFYLARARAAVARLGHPPVLAASLAQRAGQQALAAGELDRARASFEEAGRLHDAAGSDALGRAGLDMDLGRTLYQQGDYADAAATFRRIVEVYEREYGAKHPRVASALNNLGSSLVLAHELDEAEVVLEQALAIRRERLGARHGKVGQSLNALAGVQLQRGELEAALTYYREALEIQVEALGPTHLGLGATKSNIGRTLSRLGRHGEALEELSATVALIEAGVGPEHRDVAGALHGLGAAQVAAGKPELGSASFERALAIRLSVFGADATTTAQTGVALAEAQRRAGRARVARKTIERWLPVLRKSLGDEHPSVETAMATAAGVGAVVDD